MERKTLVILGSHPATRDFAPVNKRVDIWTFNESVSARKVSRTDGVFQMHLPAIWRNPANRNDPGHYEWLQLPHSFPIYMMEAYPEVPNAVAYPLEAVVADLLPGLVRQDGKGNEEVIRYFSSSVAYAIALAIHLGYQRIEIYGIEMDSNTEYEYQRPGVYFWTGLALGRGCQVVVHEQSQLFRGPLYGYEGDVTLHEADFSERAALLKTKIEQQQEALAKVNQAQQAALEAAVAASSPEEKTLRVKEYFASIKRQAQAMMDWGALDGAIGEVERYQRRAAVMEAASGTHLFSRQEFEQAGAAIQETMETRKAHLATLGAQAQQAWNDLSGEAKYSRRRVLALNYAKAHEAYLKAAYEVGKVDGILAENLMFMKLVDERVRAAGGTRSEEVLLKMIQARPAENKLARPEYENKMAPVAQEA